MITHSRSWSPITHILHVIIYIHLKSTRPKQARVIVTDCWEASYKGLFGLWWRERFKNQVIPKNKTKKQKKFIFLLIRPLYLKIIKKLCSPNITVSNQWRSHCLIYWGFLFCPWGEISRRPVYSWSLEVCSWGSALPGWDHRWWPRGLLDASPNHHPVPDIWLSSSVLKQQCPSYPPQIVWSGEERGVSCPRQLSDSHQYVPWTRTTSTDWAKNILTLIIMAYKQTLTLKQ